MTTAPAEASVAPPQTLDLRSAVMEIRQACRELGGEPGTATDADAGPAASTADAAAAAAVRETEAHRSPFFFITIEALPQVIARHRGMRARSSCANAIRARDGVRCTRPEFCYR